MNANTNDAPECEVCVNEVSKDEVAVSLEERDQVLCAHCGDFEV